MSTDGPTSDRLSDPSGVRAAIERFRDLAKYLVTVFAAIGGLLVAGTQLSAIGSLTWEHTPVRIVVGLLGFVVAIGAVIWIVLNVLEVLKPVPLSLDEVVADSKLSAGINQRRELLGSFESVAELRDMIRSALLEPEQRDELLEGAEAIVDQAAFDRVEARFKTARTKMLIGAIIGTIGIVGFTWGANPPKEETADPIVRPLPTVVSLTLTDDGRDVLDRPLGKSCHGREVLALSLGGTEDAPRVVTLPRHGCNPVQFTLQPEWGIATSTRPAPARPKPKPEKGDEGG
jgi:hypothetical protein